MLGMSEMNRRDAVSGLAALAMMLGADRLEGQAGGVMVSGGGELAHSAFFAYDKLPVTRNANGSEVRPVLHGTLPTGEFLEVHETVMPVGQMPHPPHRHTHSEMMLVREGKSEVTSEGKTAVIEPGGIAFNASGTLHGLKAVGDVPAKYFVVAVGVQKNLPA
jgi:quercetin dioxygenase-like cupin family protein